MPSSSKTVLSRPVFLVGFMCSGKTTLGEALAKSLGVPFVDLDLYIEESLGSTISRIFATVGEAEFRRIEADALEKLIADTKDCPCIIAVGGGTPCRPGIMERINKSGISVHLVASNERLVERLMLGADKRPLVSGKSHDEMYSFVESMLAQRKPFYSLANHSFDSSLLEDESQIKESSERFISEILNIKI